MACSRTQCPLRVPRAADAGVIRLHETTISNIVFFFRERICGSMGPRTYTVWFGGRRKNGNNAMDLRIFLFFISILLEVRSLKRKRVCWLKIFDRSTEQKIFGTNYYFRASYWITIESFADGIAMHKSLITSACSWTQCPLRAHCATDAERYVFWSYAKGFCDPIPS